MSFYDFDSDFTQFSNFNNFSNFEARNFLDHSNESPRSPLSYFLNRKYLSSVEQKIPMGWKSGADRTSNVKTAGNLLYYIDIRTSMIRTFIIRASIIDEFRI